MALFIDINDFKKHVGGAVSKTMVLDSINPFIDQAIREYVSSKIDSATITTLSANATGVAAVAKGLMKSAVAWFAIYEYSTVGNVQFTEGGILRTENDHFRSAFKYQEAAFRRSALKNGWSNMEQLLQLLLDKPNDFQDYHKSIEKKLNTFNLLNFTTDFAKARCRIPERYTYEALLPYIADTETFCTHDFLGDELHSRLIDRQYLVVTDEMTPEEKTTLIIEQQLIQYLRKGIAEMVYHLATLGNLIEYTGNRVISRETYLSDDVNKTASPTMDILNATYNQRREWADRYFRLAEAFIRDHDNEFPEWTGFDETETTDTQSIGNQRLKSL